MSASSRSRNQEVEDRVLEEYQLKMQNLKLRIIDYLVYLTQSVILLLGIFGIGVGVGCGANMNGYWSGIVRFLKLQCVRSGSISRSRFRTELRVLHSICREFFVWIC